MTRKVVLFKNVFESNLTLENNHFKWDGKVNKMKFFHRIWKKVSFLLLSATIWFYWNQPWIWWSTVAYNYRFAKANSEKLSTLSYLLQSTIMSKKLENMSAAGGFENVIILKDMRNMWGIFFQIKRINSKNLPAL